jgi:hypothetical protein
VAQAAEPVSLDIRSTLQLSFNLARSEWAWLVLFVAALGIAPSVGSSLFPHGGYRSASHDMQGFILYACEDVAFSMIGYFWPLTVTAMSLERRGETSPSRALVVALASALTVLPLWLITHLDLFFRLWLRWSDWLPAGPRPGYNLSLMLISASLLTTVINVFALVSVGLVTAVVIAERRDIVGSLSRTWRLMSGTRWKVLALCLLVQAVAYLPTFVWTAWRAALRHSLASTAIIFGDWAMFVLGCCVDAFWAVVVAAIYLEIRRVREGVMVGDVAPIFA